MSRSPDSKPGEADRSLHGPAVLVAATDFSEDAICAGERVAALGALLRMPIELVHVISAGWIDALRTRFGAADAAQRVRSEAAAALERQAAQLRAAAGTARRADVDVTVNLLEGSVVETLGQRAAQAEMLVVGAHGQHPFRDAALGSTGERLVRRSRRPVLVTRREAPARTARELVEQGGSPWRRILVGSDFSPYSLQAMAWARRLGSGAQVEVLHAFEAPFESKLRLAGVSEDEILRMRADSRADAQRRLKAMMAEAGLDEVDAAAVVVHGYAPHRIVDRARETGAGLIVIGKHGESALEDLLLGSVALHVLAQAGCDVLVVQP